MPVTDRAVLVLRIHGGGYRVFRRVVVFRAVREADVDGKRLVPQPPDRNGQKNCREQP